LDKTDLNNHPEGEGQAYNGMVTTDIRPFMKNIKNPTLVLGSWAANGEFGLSKGAIITSFLQKVTLIQTATLEMVEAVSHFILYSRNRVVL